MSKKSRLAYRGLIWVLIPIIVGCSSGDPVTQREIMPATGIALQSGQSDAERSDRVLWGIWDVGINKHTGEIRCEPLRDAELHVNALHFLEPPALTDLTIDSGSLVIDEPGNYVAVDVILTHPFPGSPQFSGFDVRGIVLLPGTDIPFSDPSLIFGGPGEPALVNADGWTRWWNPREFPSPGMFGFKQGLIGARGGAGVFTATVNGYKYFADGLGSLDPITGMSPSGRGVFAAGSSNRRNYQIDFGIDSGDWLNFQYAVDASWEMPDNMPYPAIPDDFPMEANAPEGYHVQVEEVENTLWWLDKIGMGGHLELEIDVYTWRPDAIERVVFECGEIIGAPVEAEVIEGSGGGPDDPVYSTYLLDIRPDALTNDDTKDCLVTVTTSEEYAQNGTTVFFGPPGSKVSSYYRFKTEISWKPPLSWNLATLTELPVQPSTVLCEMSVVSGTRKEGVYFFGDEYGLYRYDLDYRNIAEHVTTLEGLFGYSKLDLYGAPETLGRFELCPFGQFVASTISAAPSPTFLGGLKRDYAFFFNKLYSPGGQLPVQVAIPDPTKGFFKFVDAAANWAQCEEDAKVYWIQVDDPDEDSPPDPDITVILGVYQYAFSGNPFSGDIDYLSGSLVPMGDGAGKVDIESVDRFGVDGAPQGIGGSMDLICWFMETDPPALECFGVVSGDDSGNLNQHLCTVNTFHATPRDIAVMPTHKGGYSPYNWVIVLEEGAATWSLEAFDQQGSSWVGLLDMPGYPACLDVDPVNYQVHVWFSIVPGGPINAAVFTLSLG